MIIINDFFVRNKEAVSNQMELLLKSFGGKIISATRFMNQKSFQKEDRSDNIFIYLPFIYFCVSIKEVISHPYEMVHIFEEEPCLWKRLLLNISKNKVFISMYRRPNEQYANHVKKYHNLCKIFVELEDHKELLKKYGVDEHLICVTPTPSKLCRENNYKTISIDNIKILFASWNNKEGDAITERGLRFLLEFLKVNDGSTLSIPLRDNDTHAFIKVAKEYGVWDRVHLVEINNDVKRLIELFDMADFVAFVPQKRIVKDVPNSLIDGLMRGKPVIISDVIDFSKIVSKEKIGIVIHAHENAKKIEISNDDYKELSNNAFHYSKRHSPDNYIKAVRNSYLSVKKKGM